MREAEMIFDSETAVEMMELREALARYGRARDAAIAAAWAQYDGATAPAMRKFREATSEARGRYGRAVALRGD